VMITVPTVNACTNPVADTVATPVFDDVQLTAAPVTTFPDPSRAAAVNCTEFPAVTLAAVGETVTEATVGGGGASTVTPADAVTPPAAAVTAADPCLTSVTIPDDDTLAVAELDEDQVTVTPLIGLPEASWATAVSCLLVPGIPVTVVGDRTTEATGGGGGALTVTPTVPVTPPADAVMVAVPCFTRPTMPDDDTVAVAELDEDQVTVTPLIGLPEASWTTAVSCLLVPGIPVTVVGDRTTEATGGGGGALTVTPTVPVTPPADAVMVAVPCFTRPTMPDDDTVAVAELDEDQVTATPLIGLPEASWTTAVSCWLVPGAPVTVVGDTPIEATVGGGGALTVTPTAPATPLADAVMVAVPCLTSVTSPEEETFAADASDDVHDTVGPTTVLPEASLSTAVSCEVVPAKPVIDPGDSTIDATGAASIVAPIVALTPLAVAVIVAAPCLTSVTRPLEETVAFAELDDHVTATPVTTAPLASVSAALTCAVLPGTPEMAAGESAIFATGPTGGAATVTSTSDATPVADAVIDAAPCLERFTIPDDDTVATDVFDDDQRSAGGVAMVAPVESLNTAVICVELPGTPLIVAGDSWMLANTGSETVVGTESVTSPT
jgi:hypothetical protein